MTILLKRRPSACAAVFAAGLFLGAPAGAQQAGPGAQRPPAAPPPKAAAAQRDSGATGEAVLRQRIEQLEEQLVDMQVVVGTLESLARGATASPSGAPSARPGGSAASALNAADAGRLDSLEMQLQALAAQLQTLQDQVRALAARSGSLAPPNAFAGSEPAAPQAWSDRAADNAAPPPRGGFGSLTVSPGASTVQRDDIDQILSAPPGAQAAPGLPPVRPSAASAPQPPAPADGDIASKQLYETAYGYLLQRDYGAAEAAFEDFLQRYPNDPLAGNAQYWLGESLYVRGQYRSAAGAFLKGYQNYSRSAKAAESLLKLAMSLQRLGQKDAACSSFNELTAKYPSAPPHVKTSAQAERQRAGC